MSDPRALLDRVVGMIEKDIGQIEKLGKNQKLHTDDASDLVRYSKALLDIIKDKDESKKEGKKTLDKMATADLIAAGQAAIESLKNKDENK